MGVQKTIPLPLSSYQLTDLRASSKRLVGCYPEPLEQDAGDGSDSKDGQPATLRRWPGISSFFNTSNPQDQVRGMWEMIGLQFAVIGPNLYILNLSGGASLLNPGNPIPGTGIVRMTDNGACLVILVPGTTTCFTWTPGDVPAFAPLTASFFLNFGGAIDCWFVDTYIVFLANNAPNGGGASINQGSFTFFNDDGRAVSGSHQITFTTAASFSRAFGTDPFFGMAVDHREVLMFGSRTSEGYVNTGNPVGSPFTAAPDSFMSYGVHVAAPYTIALQDNSVFWIANDFTVRRRSGQTPIRVSNAGIEAKFRLAQKNGQLVGCYALTPTWDGHPFYIITVPAAGFTVAYDCVTQKWFDLVSLVNGNETYWRPQAIYNGFGGWLVGDSFSGNVGFMDGTVFTEYNNSQQPVVCGFTCQPIYQGNRRMQIRRIECVVTPGEGQSQAVAPVIDLLESDNWGQTFSTAGDPETLGTQSDFSNRSFWLNRGQSRSRVNQFRVTDATPVFTVDVQAIIEVGKV